MLSQTNLWDILNATSLPVSVGGQLHLGLQNGRIINRYGPGHARVNLSARQVAARGLLTSGICGLHSSGSLSNAALKSSLASRLRAKQDSLGWTLYRLTWKELVTPSGLLICALRASARHTSGSGYGLELRGWLTVCRRDGRSLRGGVDRPNRMGGPSLIHLAGWGTPSCQDARHSPVNWEKRREQKRQIQLVHQAGMAMVIAGWCTPMKTDAKRGVRPPRKHDTGVPLTQQAGMTSNGYRAPMEKRAQLNPEFVSWLMGYPVRHLQLLPMETP